MDIIIILIVAGLSVVQSIFGMGLLVFGTPTLLLLGYPFSEILSILLPPSLTISVIQFAKYRDPSYRFAKDLLIYCLPAMCLALVLRFMVSGGLDISILVAAVLIFSVVIRLSKNIAAKLQLFLKKYTRIYLVIMGLIHGLSNMGGSFLSVYAISQHNEKKNILRCVVTAYLLFGTFQIMTLMLLGEFLFNGTTIVLCAIAAASFLTIGNRIFFSVAEPVYQPIFTIFMLVYASLLILS